MQFVGRIAVARRTRQFIAAIRFARQFHPNSRIFPRSTDVRRLSELVGTFEPLGFVQVHQSWVVNLPAKA